MLDITSVSRVYNGKVACMCGCSGKYSTNPAYRDVVGKQRGYPVSDDECNMRSVKIIAKKVLSNPNTTREGNAFILEDRVANKLQVVWVE